MTEKPKSNQVDIAEDLEDDIDALPDLEFDENGELIEGEPDSVEDEG